MGKQAKYTEAPKRPRNAKMAWSLLTERHGEPALMFFNRSTMCWVGVYDSGEHTVEEKELH